MNKRKETVEKILALLDGFGYSDSIQILDDVTYTLARTPIKLSSNKTGVSGNLENAIRVQVELRDIRKLFRSCQRDSDGILDSNIMSNFFKHFFICHSYSPPFVTNL